MERPTSFSEAENQFLQTFRELALSKDLPTDQLIGRLATFLTGAEPVTGEDGTIYKPLYTEEGLPVFSIAAAIACTGLSRRLIDSLARDGKIHAVKTDSNTWLVSLDDLVLHKKRTGGRRGRPKGSGNSRTIIDLFDSNQTA